MTGVCFDLEGILIIIGKVATLVITRSKIYLKAEVLFSWYLKGTIVTIRADFQQGMESVS